MFIPNAGDNEKRPLYEQLYRYFRTEIERGRIKPEEKLPSRRQLAARFRLSPGTVENAYSQLLAEGYIYAKEKSGWYVGSLDLSPSAGSESSAAPPRAFAGESDSLFQLKTNAVATEKFPFSTWAKLMRDSLREDDRSLLSPSKPQGDADLRGEIVKYLRKYRGIKAGVEQIVIGAGSEFLMTLIVGLLGRRRLYAAENPGYRKTFDILRANGARVVSVPLDWQGIRVEAIEESGASYVHVTPSHHFPLAVVMPAARRLQLLRWASYGKRWIIEDDYDSEFRFTGRPIPSLLSFEGGKERVIYINTFTKSLAPSLRISYMVLPESLLSVYRKSLSFYSCTVPVFEQRTLWRFFARGCFERHLNRMKTIYRSRRDAFISSLEERSPEQIHISGRDDGLHLLVSVNNGMDERQLVRCAREKGVGVYGLSAFYRKASEDIPPSTVVLGYSGYEEGKLAEAARLLSSAWFGS